MSNLITSCKDYITDARNVLTTDAILKPFGIKIFIKFVNFCLKDSFSLTPTNNEHWRLNMFFEDNQQRTQLQRWIRLVQCT